MMQFNWIFEEFKKSLITGYNSKILWGSRSIYRKDWIFIKKFINTEIRRGGVRVFGS